jgi:hypothetical protein
VFISSGIKFISNFNKIHASNFRLRLFGKVEIHHRVYTSTGKPIILGRCPSLSGHESESMLRTYLVCREEQEGERERERERNKQTARGRSTQCTNNSDSITSTSELLLRQSSVTVHAHQS